MDDFPTDLQNLILAYSPEHALLLPFERQRKIVREITGFFPTSHLATVRFLCDPNLAEFTNDEAIYPSLLSLIEQETGVTVRWRSIAHDYFLTGKELYVLARDSTSWIALKALVSPSEFLELLVEAGTLEALRRYEALTGKTLADYTYPEVEFSDEEDEMYTALCDRLYISAIRARNYELLDYCSSELCHVVNTAHLIDSLSAKDVEFLVSYEIRFGRRDETIFFAKEYYTREDGNGFRYYLSLWNKQQQRSILSDLRSFLGIKSLNLV